jgi:hypothetical protein
MIAYHVDCSSRLTANTVLTLGSIAPFARESRQQQVAALLPGSAGIWGQSILLDTTWPLACTLEALVEKGHARFTDGGAFVVEPEGAEMLRRSKDRLVELVVELTRQIVAPDLPSRLACVYAFRDLAAAKRFRHAEAANPSPIWRVEARDDAPFHEGDVSLVGIAESPVQMISNARRYWSGERTSECLPERLELLLPCPVRVTERVA